jgi:AcrR family transcriptional regulator
LTEDVRERLLLAAEALLRECAGKCEMTVRDIAARAGTSPGLVNYHFGSKDELLAAAAARIWQAFGTRWDEVAKAPDGETFMAGLKAILKDIADASLINPASSRIMVRNDLMESDFSTTRFLVRVLRKALPPEVSDRDIKTAAWFVVPPLQLLLVRAEGFADYSGIDLENKIERDRLFDYIIDRIIGPLAVRVGT